MKYPLNELSDDEFEALVASICEEILGTGTIIFSTGKDGGRDAKFTGTSNSFPSITAPWSGKFIIQAKHTVKIDASCSDSEFNAKLKLEVDRIKKLIEDKKVDYYLLFTNRKLSGLQDPVIENFLDENLGIKNVVLGEERIQKWLNDYPHIVKRHNLNRLLLPLGFYEEDLKELITVFSKTNFDKESLQKITRQNDRIPIEQKNKINEMGHDYFKSVFQKSMNDFTQIEKFFKDPKNSDLQAAYENTVADIQSKILIKRSEYGAFEEIIEYLYDFVFNSHIDELKKDRRLIRVFLHYMYFHCDIGLIE